MTEMRPVRFGTGDQLVGIHHAPHKLPARGAVLLCGPPGPEAPGLHRTLRVLGDRLARAGFHTLRFDYYATGDSLGETGEAGISRWQQDIRAAHAELVQLSGAGCIYWVGFRLGATLAAHAAYTLPLPLRCLALWDPVMGGRAYLEEIVRVHTILLGGGKQPRSSPSADCSPMEALGLPLPAAFAEELATLTLSSDQLSGAERIVVFCAPGMHGIESGVAANGGCLEVEVVAESTSPGAEAFESTVLRTDIVAAVMSKVVKA